jgi:hypothetical protein
MASHYSAFYVFSYKGAHMVGLILWLMGLNQVSLLNLAVLQIWLIRKLQKKS